MRSYLLRYKKPPLYYCLEIVFIFLPVVLTNVGFKFFSGVYLYNSWHLIFKFLILSFLTIVCFDVISGELQDKIKPITLRLIQFLFILLVLIAILFIGINQRLTWLSVNELIGFFILSVSLIYHFLVINKKKML